MNLCRRTGGEPTSVAGARLATRVYDRTREVFLSGAFQKRPKYNEDTDNNNNNYTATTSNSPLSHVKELEAFLGDDQVFEAGQPHERLAGRGERPRRQVHCCLHHRLPHISSSLSLSLAFLLISSPSTSPSTITIVMLMPQL